MSKLTKAALFARSRDFRAAKFRQWAWPIFRNLYPNIDCVGVRGNDGQTTLLFSDDKFITMDFIKFGANVGAPMNSALSVLRSLQAPLNGCFFEIGANIGTETIGALALGPFGRAIVIEPEPRNVSLLRANLALRGLSDRTKIFQVGAAHKAGTANLTLSIDNRGDHRISNDASFVTTTIDLKTADEILEEAGERPEDVSLVWVDTQGYEGFVLAGAQKLMDAHVPFIIEFTPDSMRAVGCYDLAIDAISGRFQGFYDLSAKHPEMKHPSEINAVSQRLSGTGGYVDLLLV